MFVLDQREESSALQTTHAESVLSGAREQCLPVNL